MAVSRKSQPGRARPGKAAAVAAVTGPKAGPVAVEAPALDLTQARARFTEAVNRVIYRGERILIRRHGRPVAALVPVEDLALIRELEDRIDLEDARKVLAEAKGKLIPWETVKRELGL
jgi:prevent-host-death family protein